VGHLGCFHKRQGFKTEVEVLSGELKKSFPQKRKVNLRAKSKTSLYNAYVIIPHWYGLP
jgi:hypothetical protein